jgi:transcriptional regulator with XRE-family HTH domain
LKSVEDIASNEIDGLYIKIGSNVKKYREAKSMTQLQLSQALNLKSVGLVSQAELYLKKQHFNVKHLYQLAYILEVDIRDFFEGTEMTINSN